MKYNYQSHNRAAWDAQVLNKNRWTIPVNSAAIDQAVNGNPQLVLTPWKTIPHSWLGKPAGKRILCLASGGGQQGPILSAAGAGVTTLDISKEQLLQDRFVAERHELSINLVQADMSAALCFKEHTFDMIINPISVCFIADVIQLWKEIYRILAPGGKLLTGLVNPVLYMFDENEISHSNELFVRYTIPCADTKNMDADAVQSFLEEASPLEFGHSLQDMIGGLVEAGFTINGFYEDRHHVKDHPLYKICPVFFALRAVKPA